GEREEGGIEQREAAQCGKHERDRDDPVGRALPRRVALDELVMIRCQGMLLRCVVTVAAAAAATSTPGAKTAPMRVPVGAPPPLPPALPSDRRSRNAGRPRARPGRGRCSPAAW